MTHMILANQQAPSNNGRTALGLLRKAMPTQFLKLMSSLNSAGVQQDDFYDSWDAVLNQISEAKLLHGVNKYLKTQRFEFFPNSAHTIANLCENLEPHDMGFKSNSDAFFESERNLFQPRPGFWSHVTVYTAAQHIPSHAVDYSIRSKFEREYARAIDMFLAGKLQDRKIEIKILIKHESTPEQKALRSAKIAELKQSVLSI